MCGKSKAITGSIKTRIKIGYDGGEISFQIGENDRDEINKELSLFSKEELIDIFFQFVENGKEA